MSLVVCSGCGRHAREDVCPFCGAAIAGASAGRTSRRNRSALLAGAAAALYIVDCGGMVDSTDGGTCTTCDAAASKDAANDWGIGVMYGGPCPGGGCFDAAADATDATDAGSD
jgi:hypothetical protein